MSEAVSFEFEGATITGRKGESLAAALTAAGIKTLRTTRGEAERGMFCGMGVCQECLVDIDGRPNQRACMTKLAHPIVVRREAHARPLPAAVAQPPVTVAALAVERPEILVIGAGPGGLSAAIAARRAGAHVVVLDERTQAGGQYFKQPSVTGDDLAPPDRQHRAGAALVATATALGVDIRLGVSVWGAFASREFAATADGVTMRYLPQRVIVATGAYERGWPVPGWTLPGVMTTGAAQTLWRTARRLPGQRVLIAGNGPLNLQLAAELLEGGAAVAAVVEAAPAPGPRQAGLLAAMMAASPGLIGDGAVYHWRRLRAGVPMIHGEVVTSVESGATGLRVRTAPMHGGVGRVFEVDTLCLGYGFEPANELLRGLGCAHDYDRARRQLVTRRDAHGKTSVEAVYALGDCTGLGGAKAALAEGTLVGLAAAAALGRGDGQGAGAAAAARRALARHRRFQQALWQLYAAPAYSARLADRHTTLCRCEEVSFGQIEDALAQGLDAIGAVKRQTRLGMGRCQGRYCAPVLEALLAERFGTSRDQLSGFAPRPPVKPVTIADLARGPTP